MVIGILLQTAGLARAAPANPNPFLLVQPNGTTIAAVRGGDEHFNWTSTGGYLIAKGDDGFWRYVHVVDGTLMAGDARAGLDAVPTDAATTAEAPPLWRAARQQAVMRVPPQPRANPVVSRIPTPKPAEPLLVILVEFSDRAAVTTEAQWAETFFGAGGKTVRTYFQEASRGAFRFVPAEQIDGSLKSGVILVQLDYPHPNPGGRIGDANRRIVRDALEAADPRVNFAAFDADHDGAVSTKELHIVTVVAGHDSDDIAPCIWGHKGWLYDAVAAPTLDGVLVADWYHNGSYVQVGELDDSRPLPIGPICHELAHDLGLPDLYDLQHRSYGVGTHCLMAYGAWGAAPGEPVGTTPVLLSAWCRAQLGFLEATVIGSSGTYSLHQACDPVDANILKIPTANPSEYFLLENRQLSGFDAGLYDAFRQAGSGAAGGGLAIWHIDESMEDNNDPAHKKVDLEEASEAAAGGSELDRKINWGSGRQYYYAGNVTSFGPETLPNSNLYDGTASGIGVRGVSAPGATMSVTIECYGSMAVAISGQVRAADGGGISGVVMNGFPGSPVTDRDGFYSASVGVGWSGTIRPSRSGYVFAPTDRRYTQITASRTSQDYVMSAPGGGGSLCPIASFGSAALGLGLMFSLLRPQWGVHSLARKGKSAPHAGGS